MAVSEDITKRKQAEEALRKSEERWRSVFQNSAIGMALTDLNGRFIAVNRAYQEIVGYSEEELRTLSFLDITHADYREANWALAAELLEGKRQQFQIEKQYRRKDDSLIWVRNSASLVPGTESMPRFLMTLSEDITERKKAEEALHNSEERVRLILDSAAEAIFGCDPEGTCLFCNPAAVRLLGYDDPSELLGKNMHALEHHTRADGRPYPIDPKTSRSEKRRKRRCTIARSESGSYSIPPRRRSLAAIPRVLAFSVIPQRCACLDMTIRPNCSGKTCMRWNTTLGQTAGRIRSIRRHHGAKKGGRGAAQ